MPIFRVFINNEDTGEYVIGSSVQDAYFDVSAAIPLKYSDQVELKEVGSPFERPGFPVGNHTIRSTNTSLPEQDLYIQKPEGGKQI